MIQYLVLGGIALAIYLLNNGVTADEEYDPSGSDRADTRKHGRNGRATDRAGSVSAGIPAKPNNERKANVRVVPSELGDAHSNSLADDSGSKSQRAAAVRRAKPLGDNDAISESDADNGDGDAGDDASAEHAGGVKSDSTTDN
jgi:hypothetical protein